MYSIDELFDEIEAIELSRVAPSRGRSVLDSAPATSGHQSNGTVVLSTESDKHPVTVAVVIEGRSLVLRIPPEVLERFNPFREPEG